MARAFGLPGNQGAKAHYWFMVGHAKGTFGEQANKKVLSGLSQRNAEAYNEGWEKGYLEFEEKEARREFEHGFNEAHAESKNF